MDVCVPEFVVMSVYIHVQVCACVFAYARASVCVASLFVSLFAGMRVQVCVHGCMGVCACIYMLSCTRVHAQRRVSARGRALICDCRRTLSYNK